MTKSLFHFVFFPYILRESNVVKQATKLLLTPEACYILTF